MGSLDGLLKDPRVALTSNAVERSASRPGVVAKRTFSERSQSEARKRRLFSTASCRAANSMESTPASISERGRTIGDSWRSHRAPARHGLGLPTVRYYHPDEQRDPGGQCESVRKNRWIEVLKSAASRHLALDRLLAMFGALDHLAEVRALLGRQLKDSIGRRGAASVELSDSPHYSGQLVSCINGR